MSPRRVGVLVNLVATGVFSARARYSCHRSHVTRSRGFGAQGLSGGALCRRRYTIPPAGKTGVLCSRHFPFVMHREHAG
jgi:hypothetical protein